MPEVITFVGYRPPQRFDSIPWTKARIEESATVDGAYTQIEEITLSPFDPDPSDPAARSFTTEDGTAVDYWYRIVWADGTGDTSVPTTPVQNIAGGTVPPVVVGYVTVDELARVLGFGQPTPASPAQLVAMQRCIDTGAAEIDSYLAPAAPYAAPYPPLVVSVNLDRAVDIWKSEQSPYGIVALGGDSMPSYPSRNSWRRHANRLLPLKSSFGVG